MSPWLTQKEAAARAKLSVGTIAVARRKGQLRYSGGGPGRDIRIHVEWLDAWLESRVPG